MESSEKYTEVKSLLSDVIVGKPCRVLLENGKEIDTGIVTGWLKNIKGNVYIKTKENVLIGRPGCDKALIETRRLMRAMPPQM